MRARWRRKLRQAWRYGVWIPLPARYTVHLRLSPLWHFHRRPKPYTGPCPSFMELNARLEEAWKQLEAEPPAERFYFNRAGTYTVRVKDESE